MGDGILLLIVEVGVSAKRLDKNLAADLDSVSFVQSLDIAKKFLFSRPGVARGEASVCGSVSKRDQFRREFHFIANLSDQLVRINAMMLIHLANRTDQVGFMKVRLFASQLLHALMEGLMKVGQRLRFRFAVAQIRDAFLIQTKRPRFRPPLVLQFANVGIAVLLFAGIERRILTQLRILPLIWGE
nr:hypothetical protein [Crateriforma conspicua]